MHIYYEQGPPSIGMGAAGVFRKGVSRDIDAELAKGILAKKSIVFKEGEMKEQVDPPKESEATQAPPETGKRVKEVPNGGN